MPRPPAPCTVSLLAKTGDREYVAMTIDRAVMALAGFMVLLSLVLSLLHSPYWLILTAFVGANLLQASFTGFCPAAMLFKWLGVRGGTAFS